MAGDSRYDRARPVGTAEYQQSRALHVIGELVRDYPGITNSAVAGHVAHVLHAAANELGNGRALPVEVRRAVTWRHHPTTSAQHRRNRLLHRRDDPARVGQTLVKSADDDWATRP